MGTHTHTQQCGSGCLHGNTKGDRIPKPGHCTHERVANTSEIQLERLPDFGRKPREVKQHRIYFVMIQSLSYSNPKILQNTRQHPGFKYGSGKVDLSSLIEKEALSLGQIENDLGRDT